MTRKLLFVSILAFILCLQFHPSLTKISSSKKGQEDLLTIQVYYESLCPDSKNFIVQQLYPTYQKLGKYLRIDFKPFGNAEFKPDGTGGWTFTCQHGNNECIGNLYQACLLDGLNGWMPSDNRIQVEAVNCIMSDDNPHLATEKCMENLMINQPSYELVDFCHSTNPGENLLHNYGVETAQLNPQHYFIPWITFDNVWNKNEFEAALADLESFLCIEKLSHVPECQ